MKNVTFSGVETYSDPSYILDPLKIYTCLINITYLLTYLLTYIFKGSITQDLRLCLPDLLRLTHRGIDVKKVPEKKNKKTLKT